MKLVISTICIGSLLIGNFCIFPQATAQCLTNRDDLAKIPTNTDLSGIQDFNIQLFRQLIPNNAKENFIFSPYSVWEALTLAYFGSSGRTEEQLRQALRHNDKLSALKKWRDLESVYERRPKDSAGSTLISANRAYFDSRINLRSCIQDIFQDEVKKIDFTKPQEASDHINDFVSQTTRGTIRELVSPDVVDRARLVLVNAVYFKGVWHKTFNKSDTKPATFIGLDGTRYSVDMMQQRGRFKFGYDEQLKVKVLELPYSGQSTSMILFLPYQNNQDNFNGMVQGLSSRKLEEVINRMIPVDINIELPKFKMDTTVGDELLQTLATMGITDAFDRSKADFSTFTLDRPINLDRSIQKAFIDVNEEGTEASAATAFIGTKSGSVSSFECNRPFMFVIRDVDANNILFMGAYKSSGKIDKSPKPAGEPDRSNFYQEQGKVNINSFSPQPVYSAEFSQTVNRGSQNRNPIISNHGNLPSSPDRIFSSFGESGVKSQDRDSTAFGESRGPNSGGIGPIHQNIPSIGENNKFISDGGVTTSLYQNSQVTRGNFGINPVRNIHLEENIEANPSGLIVEGPDKNNSPFGVNSGFLPDKVVTYISSQNAPSVGNNRVSIPERGVTHGPNPPQDFRTPVGNSALSPGRVVNSSSGKNVLSIKGISEDIPDNDQNIPSTEGGYKSSQDRDQNIIYFEDDGRIVQGGENHRSTVRNTHLLERNKEVNPSKGVTQSPERNIASIKENNNLIGGIEAPQNPEQNIPSFGGNRGANRNQNQNNPTFEDGGEINPDTGYFLRPNQYIPVLGGITLVPVILLPQNPGNSLPFGQNNGFASIGGSNQIPRQHIQGHIGLIPVRGTTQNLGQNDNSFGGYNGFATNERIRLSQERSNPSNVGYNQFSSNTGGRGASQSPNPYSLHL